MTSFLKRMFGTSAQQPEQDPISSEDLRNAETRQSNTRAPQPAKSAPAEPLPSGGVYLSGDSITVGGDIVGGNKYGEIRDAAAIDAALEPVENEIELGIPVDLRIEALRQLYTIGEWAKRFEPDLVAVGKAIKWLVTNTPQLTNLLRTALTNSVFPRSIRELTIVLLPEATVELS